MHNIFITGSNGFVGKNVFNYFIDKYDFFFYTKFSKIDIKQNIVLHFAGIAHDLKNTLSKDDYYEVNTELTKKIYDAFLVSSASVFIMLSSVKAAADKIESVLTEDFTPKPITHYGISKLLAEQYILSKTIPEGKRVYVLRPSMIHGPGNKGNLNLLYNIIAKGFPWPLGSFENKRSFCSIKNLCFIINELMSNEDIASGVYNVADDQPLSTNEIIKLISKSQDKKPIILNINQRIIKSISKIGDFLNLPLNSERLNKLTENYVVSNQKIKNAINKKLPFSAEDGLLNTLNSFNNV